MFALEFLCLYVHKITEESLRARLLKPGIFL